VSCLPIVLCRLKLFVITGWCYHITRGLISTVKQNSITTIILLALSRYCGVELKEFHYRAHRSQPLNNIPRHYSFSPQLNTTVHSAFYYSLSAPSSTIWSHIEGLAYFSVFPVRITSFRQCWSSALKKEVLCSSETLASTCISTRRYNLQHQHRHLYYSENLCSHTCFLIWTA
jgi:hypothetical protein